MHQNLSKNDENKYKSFVFNNLAFYHYLVGK